MRLKKYITAKSHPSLIRLHLLRSESFLLLYSILVVQIYGGRLLLSPGLCSPIATWLIGVPAILWPFDGFVLPLLFLTGLLLALDPHARFDCLCRRLALSGTVRTAAAVGILAAVLIEVRLFGLSSPGVIVALAAVVGGLLGLWCRPRDGRRRRTGQTRLSRLRAGAGSPNDRLDSHSCQTLEPCHRAWFVRDSLAWGLAVGEGQHSSGDQVSGATGPRRFPGILGAGQLGGME